MQLSGENKVFSNVTDTKINPKFISFFNKMNHTKFELPYLANRNLLITYFLNKLPKKFPIVAIMPYINT